MLRDHADRERRAAESQGPLRLDAELLAPALLHELRQPLTGLDAAAALLERAVGAVLIEREEWQLLRQQLGRLNEVVAGFDELFRAGEARAIAFEVGAAVTRAVQLLVHRVRPLARRFTLVLHPSPLLAHGAPGALVHAVTNLVGNALDAVEGAPGEARVAVRLLAGARGPEVRVSDDGPGIPEPVRVRLFEPRFSTKPPDRGNGLGLYLSRRLMTRHGGDVLLVEPRDPARLPWAATEFCIRLAAVEGT
jgi:signal transduction histidine kinase